MLRDDRGLLRMHHLGDKGWLHLLPDVQQQASLLRLLKRAAGVPFGTPAIAG